MDGVGGSRAAIREAPMFCPSCGTRNPDGVRFCRACGTNLSGRRAGTTQRPVPAASATPTPAAQAPTPTVPTDRVIGQGGRRSNPFATVAAMVVVGIFVLAVGLQVGSSTSWFGLAKPHLTPGTYTFGKPSSSPLPLEPIVVSVAEGDSVTFTLWGQSAGGNAQVSRAGKDHLYALVSFPVASLGLGTNVNNKFGTVTVSNRLSSTTTPSRDDGQPMFSVHIIAPQDTRDSIVGTWAWWITCRTESGQESNKITIGWLKVEGNGTFIVGSVSSPNAAAVAESLKAGTFQGDSGEKQGSWAKQDDGSFVLTYPDGTFTFQCRR